jgi:anaerobic selenocysteine-containing dehydrogenase
MGFDEPFFYQEADDLIDQLLSIPRPWREGLDTAQLAAGKAVRLSVAPDRCRFATPSGKIQLLNPGEAEPLPRYIPCHGETAEYPLRLMTAPTLYALNASFYEQNELRSSQGRMELLLNPADAAARGLADGELVTALNDIGEVLFYLRVTERVPTGVAVAEGVWWREFAPGERTVNALVSQRLTDRGNGSTFYDNRVEVRKSRHPSLR